MRSSATNDLSNSSTRRDSKFFGNGSSSLMKIAQTNLCSEASQNFLYSMDQKENINNIHHFTAKSGLSNTPSSAFNLRSNSGGKTHSTNFSISKLQRTRNDRKTRMTNKDGSFSRSSKSQTSSKAGALRRTSADCANKIQNKMLSKLQKSLVGGTAGQDKN